MDWFLKMQSWQLLQHDIKIRNYRHLRAASRTLKYILIYFYVT